MVDVLTMLLEQLIQDGAYRIGKELGKELSEAPGLLSNPPPYDQLTDAQRIFAGSRKEWEQSRGKVLTKRVSGTMKEVVDTLLILVEGVSNNTLSESDYQALIGHLKNKAHYLTQTEKDMINKIINKHL